MKKIIALSIEPDDFSASPWFSISKGLFRDQASLAGYEPLNDLDTDLIWDIDTVMRLLIKALRNTSSIAGLSGIWLYNNAINIIGTKEYIDDLIRYNKKIQKLTRTNSDLTVSINETHKMIMIPQNKLDLDTLVHCQQLFRHVTRELKVYQELSQNQITEAKINRLLYGEIGLTASALSGFSIFYDKKYLNSIFEKTHLQDIPGMDTLINVSQAIEDPLWNAYFTINILKRVFDLYRTGRLSPEEIREQIPKDIADPLVKWLNNRRLFDKLLIVNNLISLGSAVVPLGSFYSSVKLIAISLIYRGFDQLYINYSRQLKKDQVEKLVNHESIYAWIRFAEADLSNITAVKNSTASTQANMTHFILTSRNEEIRYYQNQRRALDMERTELNQLLTDPAYTAHPFHELIIKNRLSQIDAFDSKFESQLNDLQKRIQTITNTPNHVPKSQTPQMLQEVIRFITEEAIEEEILAKLVVKPSRYIDTHPENKTQRRFNYQRLIEDLQSSDQSIKQQAVTTCDTLYNAALYAITHTIYEQRIDLERELMALEYEQIVIEKGIPRTHDDHPLKAALQAAQAAETPPEIYWRNCLQELNFMPPQKHCTQAARP